jgi:hypothetical protein
MDLNSLNLEKILIGNKIIGTITSELADIVNSVDPLVHKEIYIHKFLNNRFKTVLKESFKNKLILIYDECLPAEILLAIHSWFKNKCCNINNIILVTTHTIGADTWYYNYTQLMGEHNLKLIEAPLMSDRYLDRFRSIQYPFKKSDLNKKLEFYFSFYGGSYGSLERDFLVTMFLNTKLGYVDYMSGFATTNTEFDNYLEQQTGFLDRAYIDRLMQIKKTTIFDKKNQIFNELFNKNGLQYQIDSQSACQIIRETVNNTPYSIITEKTIRNFIHHQIPIPISGTNCVSNLELLGFKVDHNIIDYSYQNKSVFYDRLTEVCKQIYKLQEKNTLSELEDYINNNDLIYYNYDYIASGKLFNNIKEKLIREIYD